MNRGKILELWQLKSSGGTPVKGGPQGPDFVVVSNVDRLNVQSDAAIAAFLPIGDANALSQEAAKDRVWGPIPVIAGVCATDPLRIMDNFLGDIKATGVLGVQNTPSVGLIDGSFRKTLEDTRMGYDREIEMIGLAAKHDLLTAALVFTPEQARKMAEAGADAVVVHPGMEPGRDLARAVSECAAAARDARKDVLVFGYGAAGDVRGIDGIQSE
ncbi:MAG TPA: phosphoenolpyruvate hydrolase family protein [Planctomycetota bacterium]|nr:phosphoenolpyruvate hydrolase family protein [Planctomycetota bacterium]